MNRVQTKPFLPINLKTSNMPQNGSDQQQQLSHDAPSTRNERKRRYREEQAARLASAAGNADGAANRNAVAKKPHRMPASAFLPLMAEEVWHRRCVVEYDGSNFNGFQAQEKLHSMRTVQETIEDALSRTTSEQIRVRAASRTDKGVHALGQVIVFASRCSAEDKVFRDALNNRLPDDVICRQMVRVEAASEHGGCAFDPRADSKRKIYSYTILNGGHRPVLDRHRVWYVKKRLDVEKMNAAIEFFVAAPTAKDYSSFTPKSSSAQNEEDGESSNPKGNVCALTSIKILEESMHLHDDRVLDASQSEDEIGRRLRIVFKGDRFLYKMVRNLVGTLVDIGLGRIAPESIPVILEAKNRGKAGQGAPPHGLTLVHIAYDS